MGPSGSLNRVDSLRLRASWDRNQPVAQTKVVNINVTLRCVSDCRLQFAVLQQR